MAYEVSLNGFADDEFGDCNTFGFYSAVTLDSVTLDSGEMVTLDKPETVYFVENNDGFVRDIDKAEFEMSEREWETSLPEEQW